MLKNVRTRLKNEEISSGQSLHEQIKNTNKFCLSFFYLDFDIYKKMVNDFFISKFI